MDIVIVISILIVIVGVVFALEANRRAANKAIRLVDEEARRRKLEKEEIRRQRIAEEEARRRAAERQVAYRDSITYEIKVAQYAAIQAVIIGAEIPKHDNKVVHVVASAKEAAGVAESADASIQTRTSAIEGARQTAISDALSRSNANASSAARKAASLEPADRSKVIRAARVAGIEEAMVIAIKDTLANVHGNNEYPAIANVRTNANNLDIMSRVGDIAHDIVKNRSKQIQQVRTSEMERIRAIIDAIEPANETYAQMASSIAAHGKANAIKHAREFTRDDTIEAIISRATAILNQDEQAMAIKEATTIARVMAEISTSIMDLIEDAIEDAIALTCMQIGSIQDAIAPAVANTIEVTTQYVVFEVMKRSTNTRREDPLVDESPDTHEDVEETSSRLNVPIDNYENLPKLESPAGYVYLIQEIKFSHLFKIGRTNHPSTRSSFVDLKTPGETELVAILKSDDDRQLESDLHRQYSESRKHGEWFELSGLQVREICEL